MEKSQKIFVIAFFSLLCLPLLFFQSKSHIFSPSDNRLLTEREEIVDISSLNRYFQDRLGFREELIRFNVNMNSMLLAYLSHPDFFYGKEGHIFVKPHGPILFSDYHRHFVHMVTEISRYCQREGKPFYFVFEPSKSSVYQEYLPSSVAYDNRWTSELLQQLRDNHVQVIDNITTLKEYKKEFPVFYKKNNPYHWNHIGTFAGAQKIVEAMHKDFPNIVPLTEEDFRIENKTYSSVLNETLSIHEVSPYYRSKTSYRDVSEEYLSQVQLEKDFSYFRYWQKEGEAEGLPKTLFFEGSYFIEDDKNEFLIKATKELIGIHNYQNILRFKDFYQLFKPDCVVFEVTEYTLSEYFFSEEAMKNFSLEE